VSVRHRTVEEYWNEATSHLNKRLTDTRDRETEAFLERVIAFYSFVTQDLDHKVTRNRELGGYLMSFLPAGMDLLRGAHAAQKFLSLVSVASAARIAFEMRVTFKFIVDSLAPAVYAKRFFEFQGVERLKAHYRGRISLDPQEIADLTARCADWIDPKTGKLKKDAKWHATARTLRDLAEATGTVDQYKTLYPLNSSFVHSSSLVQKLYVVGDKLRLLAESHHISQQALLVAASCLVFVTEYAQFFGIPLPAESAALIEDVRAQQVRLIRIRPTTPPATAPSAPGGST